MSDRTLTVDGETITLSHPDKVLFPEHGLSKSDLADYYQRVAPMMLPHLRGRPLTLHRFPDGIGAHGFYQQNRSDYFPDWLPAARTACIAGGVEDFPPRPLGVHGTCPHFSPGKRDVSGAPESRPRRRPSLSRR